MTATPTSPPTTAPIIDATHNGTGPELSVDALTASVRAAARRNTAIFAKVWREGFDPGLHQYDMAARVDDDSIRYQADFWPRDHGKSEIFCIAYPLRLICENPDVRILIVQKTATEAMKTLQVIKTELEGNEELKAYYRDHWVRTAGHGDISNTRGAIVGEDGKRQGAWQQQRIYVKRRRRGKDPTVEAVGVGGAITGGHFDVIILDDVEDDENTRTEDRLKYLRAWFGGTIMQLREPHTKTVMVGTFKTSKRDLYNFAINNPSWSHHVVSAFLDTPFDKVEFTPIKDERGLVVDVDIPNPPPTLWPQVWDARALVLDYLAASDPIVWRREKCNDLAAQGEVFNRDDIGWYGQDDVLEIDRRGGFKRIIQVWDTSFGEGKSDWTCCLTVGLYESHLYILDLRRYRITTPDIVDEVRMQYDAWLPDAVCVEAAGGGISVVQTLEAKTGIPIERLSPGSRSKEDRARAASIFVRRGQVSFKLGAPWVEGFLSELSSFPDVDHDDRTDTLVYAILYLLMDDVGKVARARSRV